MLYVAAAVAGIVGAYGDFLLARWARQPSWALLGSAFLFWNAALAMFAFMLRRSILARVVVLFLVANAVVVFAVTRFVLQDALSARQWVGMFVAVGGLIILETGRA
jgi:drug/metabolite transporter (DMT)-like permease